jgi:hypothetical protein
VQVAVLLSTMMMHVAVQTVTLLFFLLGVAVSRVQVVHMCQFCFLEQTLATADFLVVVLLLGAT